MKNTLARNFFFCSAILSGVTGCASKQILSEVSVDPNDCLTVVSLTEYKGEGAEREISKQHRQKTGVVAPNCVPKSHIEFELQKLVILAGSGDSLANKALTKALSHESEVVRGLTLRAMEEHDVDIKQDDACDEFLTTKDGRLTFSCKIEPQ